MLGEGLVKVSEECDDLLAGIRDVGSFDGVEIEGDLGDILLNFRLDTRKPMG